MAESGYSPEEFISASELDKYGYCPLSWWHSRQHVKEADKGKLKGGIRSHEDMERQLEMILKYEETSREGEVSVAAFSVVATGIAIASLVVSVYAIDMSRITIVLALLWLLAAAMFLYVSLKNTERALVTRRISGIPKGEIVQVGAGAHGRGVIVSERHGLRGLPDAVLRIDGELVPVEVKTGRVPRGPLFSHILQLAAYCLLIEEKEGKAPHYGILQYGKHMRSEIDYNEELQGILLNKLKEMRVALETGEAHRNHQRTGKCHSCSRRENCAERLE